jgi:hypothetical protein
VPATSTIADDFNDGVINTTLWSGRYGISTETGGRVQVPCGTGWSGLKTANAYTFDSVFLQVFPPAANAAAECYVAVLLNSPGQPDGTDLGFHLDRVTNTITGKSRTGYWDGSDTPITYNATNHAWLRIRASGANTLFETSPDGSTWTTLRTLATPAWLSAATDLAFNVESHRDAGTANFAEVDNVNTLPVTGATPTGIAITGALGGHTAASGLAASPTGLAASGALGTATTAVSRSAAPSGLAVASAVGATATALSRSAAPASLSVAALPGSTSTSGAACTPTGLAVSAGLGAPATAVTMSAAPTGAATPVAAGQPTAVLSAAAPDGLAVMPSSGTVATSLQLASGPTGLAAPAALGAVAVGDLISPIVLRPSAGTAQRPYAGTVTRP